MKRFYMGAVLASLLLSQTSWAQSSLFGRYLTDDKESVVSIEPCSDAPAEVCGYLVGFKPSGHKQRDRAYCRYRLLGGLQHGKSKLKGGCLLDVETGNAYKLTIRADTPSGGIKVVVYETLEALNETYIWEPYKPESLNGSGSVKQFFCTPDRPSQ